MTARWIAPMAACLLVAPLLVACGESQDVPERAQTTQQRASVWSCDMDGTLLTCSAALDAKASDSAAYACKEGDSAVRCPDAAAVENTQQLKSILSAAGAAAGFVKLTWACLVTGKNQFQCVRDLGSILPAGSQKTLGSSDGTSSEGSPSDGSSYGSSDGSSAGDSGGSPTIPNTCEPKDWEPYFAQLASHEYQSCGVSITFPRDIFDTSADVESTAVGAASAPPPTPGAPSCHDGEWKMRQQSWLDAVSKGCTNLNDAIVVMCQQAANYAPSTGKCNATGSW